MKLSEPDVPEPTQVLKRKTKCKFGMLTSVYKRSSYSSYASKLSVNTVKQTVRGRQFHFNHSVDTTLKIALFFMVFLLVIY
ncbi:MAG: hypothetical protein BM564_10840 [Bacteroidetes bacterium MedPE-SWsnd-G2]|nr:MAG: hypothetical protein BM564_10840 [Bacteroidetes bacterium MedPE-SWsnd-G2]